MRAYTHTHTQLLRAVHAVGLNPNNEAVALILSSQRVQPASMERIAEWVLCAVRYTNQLLPSNDMMLSHTAVDSHSSACSKPKERLHVSRLRARYIRRSAPCLMVSCV